MSNSEFSTHYNCLMQLLNSSWSTEGYCPSTFDAVLCWPETKPGTMVSMDCPVVVDSKIYASGKATRFCHPDGKWDRVGNYSACIENPDISYEMISPFHAEIMYWIYVVGYILSLISCTLALLIFLHYKSLSCLRNIIHTNIVACFAIHNMTWLLYALFTIHFEIRGIEEIVLICALPMLLLKYIILAAFCWMFVEGLFLFVNVLFSFYSQRIRFWMCSAVGWGIPGFLLFLNTCLGYRKVLSVECTDWHHASMDKIILVPILFIIMVNILFLLVIVYVLLAKLKLTTPREFERFSRGLRALFVLCPLLGVNYAIVLVQPTSPQWLSLIVSYYSVIVSSLQGLLVAIFFCFKNKEVESTLNKLIWMKLGFSRMTRSTSTNTEEFKLIRNKNNTNNTDSAQHSRSPCHKTPPVITFGEDGRLQRVEFNRRY